MYNFVRIKVHHDMSLSDWYLVLNRSDVKLLEQVHKRCTQGIYQKYGKNPHFWNERKNNPSRIDGYFYNPIRLAVQWLVTVETAFHKYDTVYINRNCGINYGDDIVVLQTYTSDKLEYPAIYSDKVTIRITKWNPGRHYYLSSDQISMFSKDKYHTYKDAENEALRYTTPNNIYFNESRSVLNGD